MPTLDLEVRLGPENPEILKGLREPIVDPEKYPTFVRALENMQPAYSVVIKLPGGQENYQQIFRSPFAYKIDGSDFGDKAEEALGKLLASLEHCCIEGVAFYGTPAKGYPYPVGFMGGTRHFLGRALEPEDEISLMPLRTPALYLQRGAADLFNDYIHEGEWICETSLYVKAKES